jgi:hypothetical protein
MMANTDFDTPIEGVPGPTPGESLHLQGFDTTSLAQPVKIADDNAYAKLRPGQHFIDPTGTRRQKPIANDHDYESLPEGFEFVDPKGQKRTKPKYEPVGYTAQTLYDMAHSEKGQRMALERSYPGKVKKDDDGFFIEDEGGTLRRPGRGLSSVTGRITAEAAPAALAAGGALLGGAAGTLAEPGGGTVVGGAAGGYGGGYLGQGFNDIISNLAGVYDPEGAEANKRGAGYAGAAGDVGGRALAAVAPTIKEGAKFVGRSTAKALNNLLGTNKENLETLLPAAEKGEQPGKSVFGLLSKPGLEVPAKEIYQEAPHLKNLDRLYREFFQQNTQRRSAEKYTEGEIKDILGREGVTPKGSILKPTEAVSGRTAGKAILEQVGTIKRELDEEFAAKIAERTRQLQLGISETEAQKKALLDIAEGQHKAATMFVEGAVRDIQQSADAALTLTKAGSNSGDATWVVAEKLKAARDALSAGFRKGEADAIATAPNGGMVEVSPLSLAAQEFMQQMPEEFASRFPGAFRQLRRVAGEQNPKTGEWSFNPTQLHISDVREIKRAFSEAADYYNLPSGFRNGVMKQMAASVDNFVQRLAQRPEWETTASLLKGNDEWFARERPIFNSTEAQAVYRQMEAGAPVDPEKLYTMVVRPNQTEMTQKLMDTMGPGASNLIKAAQQKKWVQTALKGQYDGTVNVEKFADEIVGADADGTLHAVQGQKEGDKLLKLARQIGVLKGKLDVNHAPGDTTFDIFRKAAAAKTAAEEAAKVDPLKVLGEGVKKLTKEEKLAQATAERQRFGPLYFLNNKRLGEAEAADQILKSEDRVIAAAKMFGEKSPEFELLKQVWLERFFTDNAMSLTEALSRTSPEVQSLMLPGMTREMTLKLAKETQLAFAHAGDDYGPSQMAVSAVENPFGRISGLGKLAGPIKVFPGANFGARATLGKFYKLIHELTTSPSTLRYLQKGFQSRSPEERQAARDMLKAHLQRGGAVGAGAGEATYQGGTGQ